MIIILGGDPTNFLSLVGHYLVVYCEIHEDFTNLFHKVKYFFVFPKKT